MRALILDTETTGLLSNRTIKLKYQPSMIEFYGCLVDLSTGEIEIDFEALIKPASLSDVTDEITKITSITQEMLTDAPSFPAVASKIRELIESSPIVIAHNLSFDIEMLDIEFERIDQLVAWPGDKICTVESTIHLKGYRLSMTALYQELFGEGFEDAHRARSDVMALLRVCQELYKRDIL